MLMKSRLDFRLWKTIEVDQLIDPELHVEIETVAIIPG